MKAMIYKQTFDNPVDELDVSVEDIESGFAKIGCPDCDGTGIFLMPDDTGEMCVMCKGTGYLYANVS